MSKPRRPAARPTARRQSARDVDPAGQLRAIRERVTTLCQRIKKDRDFSAIREVQDELSRVGDALGVRLAERGSLAEEPEPTTWPRDMNADSEQP